MHARSCSVAKSVEARGRPKDAEAAQAAILDAAEAAFAERGFAGARVDAIAEASGYNKSLIFHYFGDKLGLYVAIIQRARRQGSDMQARIFGSLADHTPMTSDAFRSFIERAIKESFDFYLAQPRLLRILAWEEAEGWTTMTKISSQLDQSHLVRFAAVLDRAQRAGILRQDVSPGFILYVIANTSRTYLDALPVYQAFGPGEDVFSSKGMARAREQIVTFIVHGLLVDPTGETSDSRPPQAR